MDEATVENPTAKDWRDRAEEYRVFAETAKTPNAQEAYVRVAENCDEIAARLEKLEGRRDKLDGRGPRTDA